LCLNTHTAARYLLSRSVREAGVKVVLAGEGADELAAGYRFFESAIANPVPTWRWPVPPAGGASPTAEQAAAMASELRDISRNLVYPRYFFEHRAGRLAEAQGLYSAAFARTLSARDPHLAFFGQLNAAGQLEGREAVRQAFYLWMKSSFANYVLCGERLDMAHGIEQRLPFLDHELFGFARSIPSGLLMRDGREKWILREAVRPFVTDRVYEGRKRPFVGPPYFLSDGSAMLALAQDRLRSASMASVPFFDHRAVVGFLDRLGSLNDHERSGSDPLILLLLSCSLLQEAFGLSGS
jgi:asparagine synthase (glutamine-hydrolysing)